MMRRSPVEGRSIPPPWVGENPFPLAGEAT